MRHPLSRRALIGYLSGLRLDAAAQRYNIDPFVQTCASRALCQGRTIVLVIEAPAR